MAWFSNTEKFQYLNRSEQPKPWLPTEGPAADTPLAECPLVALDIETTGLDFDNDDIVSVGLVDFTLSGIQLNSSRYWLTKPKSHLSSESVAIHEITHSDLAKAPPLHTVMDELLPLLAGKVVVAHFHHIERLFLARASERVFGSPTYFPMIDTMDIEQQKFYRPWWQRFGRRTSVRLEASRLRYSLPRYRAHHALMDAIACAELFQAQVAYHLDPQAPISDYWL
ncbi:3'-5' exonuclease [Maribrevibacterium harenarium]|uniref:3'-5' exonuclease n=1 Tax=Maribrevibacterium harenarium TaxID=2589817 RepID=A0A501WXK5_9GAMM|nr:3'-5' exonuclease [Maribrevibacterium harenarium]TPE53989.1 3'-5' exonuclease [Maribrevibacterium harenarium]